MLYKKLGKLLKFQPKRISISKVMIKNIAGGGVFAGGGAPRGAGGGGGGGGGGRTK